MPMWDEQKSEIASSIGCGMVVSGGSRPTPWSLVVKTGDDNTCMALPKFNSCQAMQCFKLHSSDKYLLRNKGIPGSPSLSCCSVPWKAGLHLGSQAL